MTMGSDPVPTPYVDFPTPEVAAARDSFALLLAGPLTLRDRAACEWLHAYATEELARRLSGFVHQADGQVIGVALEALAFDVGIVRGLKPMMTVREAMPAPKPRHSQIAPNAMRGRRGGLR